ncbi:MAG TPA: hydroxylamine reductase [Methanocorpusculum sp.]|nr:hydroxylamine reductase [Methanocorpusculum sp.]
MYCQQCQESGTPACNRGGRCGKNKEVAAYQDAVLYAASGLCFRLEAAGKTAQPCILEALFATLTNVNFDKARFKAYLDCIVSHKNALPKAADEPAEVSRTPESEEDILSPAISLEGIADENDRSLISLLIFGIKGLAAYYSHALVLGKTDDAVVQFIVKAMASRFKKLSIDERVGLALECGKFGVSALVLLDEANRRYGVPEITQVSTVVGTKPGILITGHDLRDLEMLLEQTKDSGIDIYTHGEMLPAHAYPAFKKYPHFKGNYGTSWANQRVELPEFNGPVLFTTNCLVPPLDSYKAKVFTTGAAGFEGCTYIQEINGKKDFTPLINAAKGCVAPKQIGGTAPLLTGCARESVLALAGKVIELINAGKIRRFVVMAGCDGRDKEREYYTEFAKALPKDTVILTAGCAKYRYNSLDLGDIEGIARVLDAGQCNDCYSLVAIALALAEAFKCGVNDLPISYNIAWYEQKAVLVLLVLLHLGVKNIMLGPTLPKFVSPAVLDVLVKTFNLQPSTTVEQDLKTLNCL